MNIIKLLKMKRFIAVAGIVGTLLLWSFLRSKDLNDLGPVIMEHMEETNTPSVSVAVAKDGNIIWEQSYGWADKENRIEATPHTMYGLGSIAKIITATGLMVLSERGLVDINQPADNYLGDVKLRVFEGNPADVTIRRILHHTSGLPTHYNMFFENSPHQRPAMSETIRRYGIIVSPPGSRLRYANLGYGIIEHIIEQVSGIPYIEFMKSEVFLPLNMRRTDIIAGYPDNPDIVAKKYTRGEDKHVFLDCDHRGAGPVIHSSAHDLVRFGMFHLKNHLKDQKPILTDKTIDLMKNSTDPISSFRFAWTVYDQYYYTIVRHSGGGPGIRAMLQLMPSQNTVVVVLANGEDARIYHLAHLIFAKMFSRYSMMHSIKNGIDGAASLFKPSKATTTEKLAPPDFLTGTWEGKIFTHQGDLAVRLVIEEHGDVFFSYIDEPDRGEKRVRASTEYPASFNSGRFTATFPVQIKTDDAGLLPHETKIDVRPNENAMNGTATAYANNNESGLSSYIKLRKIQK